MLGVTTAGPALLAQASSTANKVLRSGVSILPMHKGVRQSGDHQGSHAGYENESHAILGGQFAFVKHCLEGGALFVSCT